MPDSILITCTGNICRSPVNALVGQPCYPHTAQVAACNSIDTQDHRFKQLDAEMCRNADLILVMEKPHMLEIFRLVPMTRGKVMLFGKWLGEKEVPDPYRKSQEFSELAFDLMRQAAQVRAKVLADEK